MATHKYHRLVVPDHPLLGRVVEVRKILFMNRPPTLDDAPDLLDVDGDLEVVYEDGRTFTIIATGYEAEGLEIRPGKPSNS